MTMKPTTWHRIALALTAINLAGFGWAVRAPAEPMHAALHVVLALGFGLWARRLQQGLRGRGMGAGSEDEARLETDDRLEALGAEVDTLRRELSEAQERIDFAERLLARRPEPPR